MTTPIRQPGLWVSSIRKGVAAVECAVVVPLLMLVVLGSVDVGQYANAYQKVSDASREGARVAARYDTVTQSQVATAVMNYLHDAFPGLPPSTLAAATNITVTDAEGNTIPSGDLSSVATGSQLSVTVTLQYDLIRWLTHIEILGGSDVTVTTKMRRE